MQIFCRHCWKDQTVKLKIRKPHISADCKCCGNWVKHLNSAERTQALIEGLPVHDDNEYRK